MIWSNRWAGRSILYVVTLTGILTPLPLVALSQYNHPHADDYCAAVWADIWGLLGAQGYVYLNWSGRYFATLLRTTSPITFRWIAGYKVVTLFLLLLFPVSLYWLIDRALRTKPLETAALTSGVFTTFVFGMPSIASGFYWFSGAVTYVFSAILFMFLLGFLIQLYEGEGRTRPKVLACCFLLLAVVGSNETLMFIWGLFVGVTTMIQLVYRGVLDRFWVVLLFLSLTSCLIVLNAPGNDIRLATFAQGSIYPTDVKLIGSIGAAARSSMIRAFDQAWHWLFASPLWLFSLLVLPMAAVYSGDKVKSARSLYQVSLPLVVIVEAMLFTAAYFPSYWATNFVESRTENAIFLYFLLGWLYFLWLVGQKFQRLTLLIRVPGLAGLLLFLVGMTFHLAGRNNIGTAYHDWTSGLARRYDQDMQEVYKTIASCREPVCTVPEVRSRPKTIVIGVISPNPDDWKNWCLSAYFFQNQRKIRSSSSGMPKNR